VPWKELRGKPSDLDVKALAEDPDVIKEIDSAVAEANKSVSKAEAIKKYRILTVDFTEEGGHMTPSLKVKRHTVAKDFAAEIESIYS
jgi:long-chain acyl-CoA synthetase